MNRINTPVLVEISQPALHTKLADLFNKDHPINNKSMSGKRKGMVL